MFNRINKLVSSLSAPITGGGPWHIVFTRDAVRKALSLYSSEIGLIILTFGTGILNSRFLGPKQYGVYTFVITIVEAIMLFAGFGYPNAGARMVALAKNKEDEKATQGALVLIAVIMGLGMSLVLGLISPVINHWFHLEQKNCLLIAAMLCVTAPMQMLLAQACRGANRIDILILLNILPKALYLAAGFCLVYWGHLTAMTALLLYFFGGLAACAIAILALRVRFDNLWRHVREITGEVKRFGFNTYIGGLADQSTYKLNNLLIAGCVDTTWLGFYSIASTMVSPMPRFSTSISAVAYRSLAKRDHLGKRLILVNLIFLLVCSMGLLLFARIIIERVLTPKYLPATGLVYVLIVTAFFQGMYQPFTAFLNAHGKGRESRSISFMVSIVNFTVAAILIPRLGAYGAAISSGAAKFCEFLGNVYYYKKVTREFRAVSSFPVALEKPVHL